MAELHFTVILISVILVKSEESYLYNSLKIPFQSLSGWHPVHPFIGIHYLTVHHQMFSNCPGSSASTIRSLPVAVMPEGIPAAAVARTAPVFSPNPSFCLWACRQGVKPPGCQLSKPTCPIPVLLDIFPKRAPAELFPKATTITIWERSTRLSPNKGPLPQTWRPLLPGSRRVALPTCRIPHRPG